MIFDPVQVKVFLQVIILVKNSASNHFQIKSINEINLNEEYMDVSIVLTEEWTDKQLTWVTGKTALTSLAENDEKSQSDTKSRRRRSQENDAAITTTTTDSKERGFLKK